MRVARYTVLILAAVPAVWAQEGAKALFHDTTSGVTLQSSGPGRDSAGPVPAVTGGVRPAVARAQGTSRPSHGDVTGVMYWVETKTPTGQLLRVNASNRTFHSGERIRLHVTSNVDGKLSVLQSQDGGPFEVLYPRSGSNGKVTAQQDLVIPSSTAWFRFDNNPGNLRLMLMVQADHVGGGTYQIAQARRGSGDDAGALERQMRERIEGLRGSKALVMEDDSSEHDAATYAVVDARRVENAPKGVVAVEIRLAHR